MQAGLEPLLVELGYGNAPEADKPTLLQQLQDHFYELLLEVVIENLPEDQLEAFEAATKLEDATARDEAIVAITAKVPGLLQKMDEAITREIAVIKTATAQLGA
jgi:hypothetical protein